MCVFWILIWFNMVLMILRFIVRLSIFLVRNSMIRLVGCW